MMYWFNMRTAKPRHIYQSVALFNDITGRESETLNHSRTIKRGTLIKKRQYRQYSVGNYFFPRLLLPPLSLYHLFYGMETYKTIFPKIWEGDEAQRSAHQADYPNRLFIPILFNIHKYHVTSSYIYMNIPAI